MDETSELGLLLVGTVAAMVHAFEEDEISEVDLYHAVENAMDEYFLKREAGG
jgi:hypothetical protein